MNNLEKFLTISTSFIALIGVYFNFLETALGLFSTAICIIILCYNFIKWEYDEWIYGDQDAKGFQNLLKYSHRALHLILSLSLFIMLSNSILVSQFPSYVTKETCRKLVLETEKTHPDLKEISQDTLQLKLFTSKIEKSKAYAAILNQNILQVEKLENLLIELGEDYKGKFMTFGWLFIFFISLFVYILLILEKIGYKSYSFNKK